MNTVLFYFVNINQNVERAKKFINNNSEFPTANTILKLINGTNKLRKISFPRSTLKSLILSQKMKLKPEKNRKDCFYLKIFNLFQDSK